MSTRTTANIMLFAVGRSAPCPETGAFRRGELAKTAVFGRNTVVFEGFLGRNLRVGPLRGGAARGGASERPVSAFFETLATRSTTQQRITQAMPVVPGPALTTPAFLPC